VDSNIKIFHHNFTGEIPILFVDEASEIYKIFKSEQIGDIIPSAQDRLANVMYTIKFKASGMEFIVINKGLMMTLFGSTKQSLIDRFLALYVGYKSQKNEKAAYNHAIMLLSNNNCDEALVSLMRHYKLVFGEEPPYLETAANENLDEDMESILFEAAYNIPISSVEDIENFNHVEKEKVKQLYGMITPLLTISPPKVYSSIPLVGSSDGKIKVRIPTSPELDKVKEWVNDNGLKNIAYGSGSIKLTGGIYWETGLMETAQCLGVYVDGEKLLSDVNKALANPKVLAKTVQKWIDTITSALANGQDWDSSGASKLKSVLSAGMIIPDLIQLGQLINGMTQFSSGPAKGLKHITHGSIIDYYAAEEQNQTVQGVKSNTADMIISNVPTSKLISAIKTGKVTYEGGICKVDSVEFAQVSLKKSISGAQLGKITSLLQQKLNIPSYSKLLDAIISENVSVLSEGFLSKLKSLGQAAVFKMKQMITKAAKLAKMFAMKLGKSFKSQQKKDLAFLEKKLDLKEGTFKYFSRDSLLNEAKKKNVFNTLRDLSDKQISLLYDEVEKRQQKLLKTAASKSHISAKKIGKITTPKKITPDEAVKLFANYTTLYILEELLKKSANTASELVDELLQIQKEMYFGKTLLPLYKVYGASSGKKSYEFLNSGKHFVDSAKSKLSTVDTDVLGVSLSTVTTPSYYVMTSAFLLGLSEDGTPEYSHNRMGTNQSGKFSYTFEGSGHLNDQQFKNKFV